jgi:hypothetical protein
LCLEDAAEGSRTVKAESKDLKVVRRPLKDGAADLGLRVVPDAGSQNQMLFECPFNHTRIALS